MCGIFGYITKEIEMISESVLTQRASEMQSSLSHRGPDGAGVGYSRFGFIGNTRLSIIDVLNGMQPFYSDDQQIIVVQNGEIFNYEYLKNKCFNNQSFFKTNSDTEVILRLYEKFGIDFISQLEGMFAIAIIDLRKSKFFLIRDRVGEKPLFYIKKNSELYFSSEINTLVPYLSKITLSKKSIVSFLTFNYVPQPSTIFCEIKAIRPGHYLEYDFNDLGNNISQKSWWSLLQNYRADKNIDLRSDESELVDVLKQSMNKRLTADVPVCLLLSGGIDSSTIAYFLNDIGKKLDSYTVYFGDKNDPDLLSANNLTKELNFTHKVLEANSDIRNWEVLLKKLGQPFGDTSFLSLNSISNLVSSNFKVAISGDGADEIFGGYLSYHDLNSIDNNSDSIDNLFSHYLSKNSVFRLEELQMLFQTSSDYSEIISGVFKESIDENFSYIFSDIEDSLAKYLFLDMSLLLPSNNLFKSDMCSMFNQVELRSPFLENSVLNYFFRIKPEERISSSYNKVLIRNYLVSKNKRFGSLPKRKFAYPFINEFQKFEETFSSQILKLADYTDIFSKNQLLNILNLYKNNPLNYYRKVRNLLALSLWLKNITDININEYE